MSKEASPRADRAQRLADAVGRGMYARDRAAQALGIRLVEIGPGHALTRMTVRQDMVNGHDTCHGGLIFTLADAAFGYSCNSHNRNAVAQHCTITFLKPAKLGEVLTAEATEQTLGGRNGVSDIKVTNERGELVALFRGNSRVIAGEVVAEPGHPECQTSKEPS
ncbi:MAG TPA: hydroxyphenylacetyl-CoA thioesterase PaaI [Alphaproteobacteria bacterium]|nr:hydroxyphenylacetyl-CoA thioesterase PaaI [Alphaproteobacteria bacterium]